MSVPSSSSFSPLSALSSSAAPSSSSQPLPLWRLSPLPSSTSLSLFCSSTPTFSTHAEPAEEERLPGLWPPWPPSRILPLCTEFWATPITRAMGNMMPPTRARKKDLIPCNVKFRILFPRFETSQTIAKLCMKSQIMILLAANARTKCGGKPAASTRKALGDGDAGVVRELDRWRGCRWRILMFYEKKIAGLQPRGVWNTQSKAKYPSIKHKPNESNQNRIGVGRFSKGGTRGMATRNRARSFRTLLLFFPFDFATFLSFLWIIS